MAESGYIQILVQLGSFGLLSYLVWFAVTRWLPDREQAFLAELDRKRQDFTTVLEAREKAHDVTATQQREAAINALQHQQAAHDLSLQQQRTDFLGALSGIMQGRRDDQHAIEREVRALARSVQQLTIAVLVHHSSTTTAHDGGGTGTQEIVEMLRHGAESWGDTPAEGPR